MGKDVLKLRIADNGIGKSLSIKPQGTGFGTQLVALLTKQLDGTIEQDVENGTMISIMFRKAKAA
jgi:two-component sensor histidine kinase